LWRFAVLSEAARLDSNVIFQMDTRRIVTIFALLGCLGPLIAALTVNLNMTIEPLNTLIAALVAALWMVWYLGFILMGNESVVFGVAVIMTMAFLNVSIYALIGYGYSKLPFSRNYVRIICVIPIYIATYALFFYSLTYSGLL